MGCEEVLLNHRQGQQHCQQGASNEGNVSEGEGRGGEGRGGEQSRAEGKGGEEHICCQKQL